MYVCKLHWFGVGGNGRTLSGALLLCTRAVAGTGIEVCVAGTDL